ncbi:kynurenine formamidase, partial [Phenoliferia sp. Uapishka_3]
MRAARPDFWSSFTASSLPSKCFPLVAHSYYFPAHQVELGGQVSLRTQLFPTQSRSGRRMLTPPANSILPSPTCPFAESKSDLRTTLIPFLLSSTKQPLAVLEYRHAPAAPHPAQINDVLSALSILTSSSLLAPEGPTQRWDRRGIILMGHSAGAFMAASIILAPPKGIEVAFEVSKEIRNAVAGIICVDGIYDLPDLLDEYPTYDYFVHDAFGRDSKVLEDESPARWNLATKEEAGRKVGILVLHSREDELLTLRQPEFFLERMREKDTGSVFDLVVDYDSIKGTHDDLIKTEVLAKVVANWLATR